MKANIHSKIVCTAIGFCHNLGVSDNGFEKKLFSEGERAPVMLIDEEKLEKELSRFANPSQFRRIDKASKMGLLASQLCYKEAPLDTEKYKDDIGVVMCSNFGGIASSRDFINSALKTGYKNASPIIFPYSVPNAATGVITIQLGVRGFNTTISGFNPIGYAYELLKLNKAKALLAGGVEELIQEILEANNSVSKVAGTDGAAAPYLSHMAEGSAVMMLTTEAFAQENNQKILFEIRGVTTVCNLTKANNRIDNMGYIEADAIQKAMAQAMEKAGVEKEEIRIITSLSGNQGQQKESEQAATQSIWGDAAPTIWNIKEAIGETFGMSDTWAAITSYYYLKQHNITEGYALINSYQVGGNISSALIKLHA